MTKLITIPKFAKATGLTYRLCLQLVSDGLIPSVRVGGRRRIDVRWAAQWLAEGGYQPTEMSEPADATRRTPVEATF
jgi:excisionase family DNA binding protein